MTEATTRTESFRLADDGRADAELVRLQQQYPGWTGAVLEQTVEPDGTIRAVIQYSQAGRPQSLNPLGDI